MGLHFLPKQTDFFVLFDKLANVAVSAATYFKEIAAEGKFDEEAISKIREFEHEGDEVTHDIFNRLDTTFITPFDREDIHALADELDSVIDMLQTMTNRLKIYKVSSANEDLVAFASVIEKSVCAMAKAVSGLRDTKNRQAIREHCVEVNRLENVGDTMRDTTLGKLFENPRDPYYVIKWKEIFQDAETVLDVCEDVANVISSIMVKQA